MLCFISAALGESEVAAKSGSSRKECRKMQRADSASQCWRGERRFKRERGITQKRVIEYMLELEEGGEDIKEKDTNAI